MWGRQKARKERRAIIIIPGVDWHWRAYVMSERLMRYAGLMSVSGLLCILLGIEPMERAQSSDSTED